MKNKFGRGGEATEMVPLTIFITKEDEWFVASCPLLDIATQGKTEDEVRDNMKDLIDEYMEDPDTSKPALKTIMSASAVMTTIPIRIKGTHHDRVLQGTLANKNKIHTDGENSMCGIPWR